MRINIITLFPDFFSSPLESGLMRKAVESGLVDFSFLNPRDFTDDKRQTVDDRPYGGGPGMVMLLEPLAKALGSLGFGVENCGIVPGADGPGRLLVMSPRGRTFDQALARELSQEKKLTFICGRYEGFDARLADLFPVEEISIGDFVLNGGETAALAVSEAACRLLPGFMGRQESGLEESFSNSLLEYPHYTRPEVYQGLGVPEILRGGDHGKVGLWRRRQSVLHTLRHRPELLETACLDEVERALVRSQPRNLIAKNLYTALIHYPVLDKDKKSAAVSLTNLDIHDIARSSCCYGLGAFFIVTPLEDQLRILHEVLEHWTRGPGALSNPDRKTALSTVVAAKELAEAVSMVEEKRGQRPLLFGSSAKGKSTITFDEAGKILYTHPVILLLGTGHGLAPEVLEKCDHLLPPLRGFAEYNHFSVRSAAAILLDRILGEWG